MANNDLSQLCYLVVLVAAVCFVVYGFVLLLQKKQKHENVQEEISRQIRGMAFVMLGGVTLSVGTALCFGLSGGFTSISQTMKGLGAKYM